MKSLFGWVGMVVLAPFILLGTLSYLIFEALVFGWELAEDTLEDWDD